METTVPRRKVLIISARNIKRDIATAYTSEFEDVVREIEGADLLTPELTPVRKPGWFRNGLRRRARISIEVVPRPIPCSVSEDYDLLLYRCRNMNDLLVLSSIRGWRERSRYAVTWLEEPFGTFTRGYGEAFEILSRFDQVVVGIMSGIDPISARLRCRPAYVMEAVDALRFSPHPEHPPRVIDVYSMGRRSETTHRALLSLAERGRFCYLYDTVQKASLIDGRQHRLLLAGFIKRTRYFIANKSFLDLPTPASSQSEIPIRFFEGAAAGSVMVGDPPDSDVFRRAFDWPGAVIPFPWGSTDIGRLLEELEGEPERVRRIRQENSIQSLLRHDWLYRWNEVLKRANLPPTEGILRREGLLHQAAEAVRRGGPLPTASALEDAQVD